MIDPEGVLMPVETVAQSRLRVVRRIKSGLLEALRGDLRQMARTGALPDAWIGPRDIAQQLDQTGYWLSHDDPMAPFLSAEQCVAMIASALNDLAREDARIWWRHGERYRPHNIDWCLSARQTADRLRASRPAEERTAIYRGVDEASVIFANEEFANGPSVRRQVALLREALQGACIPELGFAISTDGGAWVMLVWTTSENLLQSVFTTLWRNGVGDW